MKKPIVDAENYSTSPDLPKSSLRHDNPTHKKRLTIRIVSLLSAIFIGLIIVSIIIIAVCFLIINPYKKFILPADTTQNIKIGLVLGAGISQNGKPYEELEARLDSAATALNSGTVDKLILSGDNRFKEYDEPTAMLNYLIEKRGISAGKLQRDFAGRSTYESCERAAKIFEVKKMIIFSATSHLPRAIYLCRHFGIETYGIGNQTEANNSTRREPLARVKAIYNTNFMGEPTVLGVPLPL